MGGPGSGGGTNKTRADSLFSIGIRELYPAGIMNDGTLAIKRWCHRDQEVGNIGLLRAGESLLLAFNTPVASVDQVIPLTPIPCHLGGKRYYFLCPECSERVGVLYLNSLFLCRNCSNVTYDVKSETKYDKMLRRSRNLRRKLGVEERPFGKIDSRDWSVVGKLLLLEEEMIKVFRTRLKNLTR